MVKQSDLSVITKAKDLSSYILTITDKSPKKFRFTLVSRLQNYSLTIIECLLTANEVRVVGTDGRIRMSRHVFYQSSMNRLPESYMGNNVNNNHVNNENAVVPAWP